MLNLVARGKLICNQNEAKQHFKFNSKRKIILIRIKFPKVSSDSSFKTKEFSHTGKITNISQGVSDRQVIQL